MAHIESTVLRDRLVKLLHSKACHAINFEVMNIRVRGVGYETVAEAIGRQSSNGISIEINAEALRKGNRLAAYMGISKTFVFSSETVGANGPRAAYENMALIHEATHAQIDLVLPGGTDALANEAAAYIAQGAYNYLTGSKFKSSSNNIWKEADIQGRKIAPPYISGYVFDNDEIGVLLQHIRGDYSSVGVETDSNRTSEIVEPVGVWKVEARGTSARLRDPAEFTWIYDFKPNGIVSWANAGSNELGGTGNWKLSRADVKVYITWKGTSARDAWTAPQNTSKGLTADVMFGSTKFADGRQFQLYGTLFK